MLEIERNLSADDESCNTLNFSQAGNVAKDRET